MTTANSPRKVLKMQADKMAIILKSGKYPIQENKDTVRFAIAMDDKIVTIEMRLAQIGAMTEKALSEFILTQMQKRSGALQ